MKWDVVVVGGGPAGSLAAYHMAKTGMRVALVDAGRFPRNKACGGGVQLRTANWIPFDWSGVVKSSLDRAHFSYRMGDRFSRHYPEPLVQCVLRSEFDELLVRQASLAGVSVFEGVRTRQIDNQDSRAIAHTTAGEFRARYLVGADGANSLASKVINPRTAFYWQTAIYVEIPTEMLRGDRVHANSIRIDWGTLPSGYAWVFPKDDKVNIGVGCPSSTGRLLREYFRMFLAAEGLMNGCLPEMRPGGHQLPTLTPATLVASKSLFLVGDAAGLVEPLTGEGISYACHSAKLAASNLAESFDKPCAAERYRAAIYREIGAEIIWARRLLSLAVSFPRLFYRIFQHSDDVWSTFSRVLRGERTFEDLRKRVLGPLEVIGAPIDALVRGIERRRLSTAKLVAFAE